MSESGRVALPNFRKSSGGPLGSLRDPLGSPVVVGWPSRMSGSGQKALPDVRQLSGEPPGCLGVVGRLSHKSESGLEALPDDG